MGWCSRSMQLFDSNQTLDKNFCRNKDIVKFSDNAKNFSRVLTRCTVMADGALPLQEKLCVDIHLERECHNQ